MTQKTTEKPFSDALTALFTNIDVPIHELYRLSDMSAAETAEFEARWPGVDEERRRVIARHMADLTENNYVVDFAPAFGFMLTDPAAAVRLAALDGIWDTSNTGLIGPITHLMQQDDSTEVRTAAAAALAHYVLMAEWGQLPRHFSGRLVETLLAEYDKPDTPAAVKRAALEAMSAADHPRIETLILAAYHSGDFETQLSAVFAMGSSADPRWLPTVLDELENEEAAMQVEAARAAGTIGAEQAIPALARLALSEELTVALTAVHALGQIGGSTAYRILSTLLDDPEFERLHEAAGEAIEEMDWLEGNIEFGLWSDVDDDEDVYDSDSWDN
jgi:hypothetical protein